MEANLIGSYRDLKKLKGFANSSVINSSSPSSFITLLVNQG